MAKQQITTRPFTYLLIEAVQQEGHKFENVHLSCRDGSVMGCGLLLAAISPLIRQLGKEVCYHDQVLTICLPDFSVNQVQGFLSTLMSEHGPQPTTANQFQQLLDFFGQEQTCPTALASPPADVPTDLDLSMPDESLDELLHWDDDDVFEDTEPEEDMVLARKSKKKKVSACSDNDLESINEEARKCYDPARSLYTCSRCGTERKNTRSMQQHLLWHEKYPDEDFHTSHICKECGKICADHSLLRAHVRLVHSPRTFACTEDDCSKSFKSKEGLKQHLLVHSGVKNFVCSQCGYAVRTKHHLKLHVLKRHTDMKKTIPCEVCGKLFRHISNLKCHFYTHKARLEREHRCDTCNLTFRTQKSLDSHMALHDPSRPFKCRHCPLRYKNKDALVAHENTHQHHQYKCQHCDIAYTRKDNLKRHIKEKHS